MKFRDIIRSLEPYVAGKAIPGGIKLASNENPLGPSPLALTAASEVLTGVSRYPDGTTNALRTALAARWDVEPDMVVIGNGSDEILVMVAGALVEPGTNCVTGEHTFSQYGFATQIFGGELRATPMPDGAFDLAAIARDVDEKTRIVFLCNPNSPTGTIIPRDEMHRFVKALSNDVVIVIDEAYGEFADDPAFGDSLDLVRRHDNVIRTRTFSKVYGLAGLRIGYGIGNRELIDSVGRLRQPFNSGSVGQVAACAALGDSEHVRATLANNKIGKDRLYKLLHELGIPYFRSQANFVCAELGDRCDEIVASVEEAGISIRPLASFGMPEHVRITIGTEEEMNSLASALRSAMQSAG
jgi:histidinol-phosphate aminotransferase